MIDAGLVSLLAADAGVQAALAANGAAAAAVASGQTAAAATPLAFYQGDAPPDRAQYPCVAYSFVGGQSKPTLSSSGAQRSRIQLDCWGVTPDSAKAVAEAVRLALNGAQGVLSDGTPLLSADMIHPGIDFVSSDSLFFRRMLEFYLLYTFTS